MNINIIKNGKCLSVCDKKLKNKIRPIIYKKLYNDLEYTYLDKFFRHYLITGEDSWSNIDRKYWFKVPLIMNNHVKCNDCYNQESCTECMNNVAWWDIRTLLIHITQCLNSSNMGNSYPQYPSDPFTRVPIPYKALSQIYCRAKELRLQIHCSALVFLYMINGRHLNIPDPSSQILPKLHINNNYNNYNNYNYNNYNNAKFLNTDELNEIMLLYLRFRNINSQDSQGNFIGIWEPKYTALNQFERSYRQYCQHPPYIFEANQEIVNPRRKLLENMLHQLPKEEWNYELDTYPADANPCQFHPKGLRHILE